MHRPVSVPLKTSTSLKDHPSVPQADGSTIQWRSSKLHVDASWRALADPVCRTLLETETGNLEWNCLQPNAEAVINLDNGRRIAGLGYVEHMTLSIPPWRLPIDELRWGRFLSPKEALVWIDWRGEKPLRLVFHNGKELETTEITDRGIEARDLTLSLDEKVVIREGPLVTTVLSAIPGIQRLFPVRMLGTHECKWLSRGMLKKTAATESSCAKNEVVTDWAIHEVVTWPSRRTAEKKCRRD